MSRPVGNIRCTAQRRAMTLIELIAVMALLAMVLTLSAPALSRFFGGRALEEEARRMLALTRYGRSEAVSRAVPMELWIDTESGTYGLSPQPGYGFEDDKKSVEFNLAEGLRFEVDAEALDEDGKAKILFCPDGAIDEGSLGSLLIRDNGNEAIAIAQVDYGLGYEIQQNDE